MLPATGKTWQLWKSCWTGVQSESTGNSRPPEVFHHHLLTSRYVNIRDVWFYLQMHSMLLLSQMKSRSTTKFCLTILRYYYIVWYLYHFPATHTPSVAPRDDGILPPSNENTTSSNRGMSGVCQYSRVGNWCNVVTSYVWQIFCGYFLVYYSTMCTWPTHLWTHTSLSCSIRHAPQKCRLRCMFGGQLLGIFKQLLIRQSLRLTPLLDMIYNIHTTFSHKSAA